MSSEDDDDLKALRIALLSTIRDKKTDRSQEIYDTDIDDLDALRNAALKSVKPDVKYSVNINNLCFAPKSLRPTSLCPQFATQSSSVAAHQPRLPIFRLRPPPFQPRSNLIVIRTVPEEGDVIISSATSNNNSTTSSKQLILPQDRYQNTAAPTEKVKRSDKWARFEEDSSSSDSEDEEITAVDEANFSRSDDESADEDEEIIEENDYQQQSAEECAGRVSSSSSGPETKPEENVITESSPKEILGSESLDGGESRPRKYSQHDFDAEVQPQTSGTSKNLVVQQKKQTSNNYYEDDLFLEEPTNTIEFLEDEPVNYEAIVASLKKNNNDDSSSLVATTATENDTSSTDSERFTTTTKMSSSTNKIINNKNNNEKKQHLKNKLNEVERKLAEIYGSGGDRDRDHRRRRRSKSNDRKHNSVNRHHSDKNYSSSNTDKKYHLSESRRRNNDISNKKENRDRERHSEKERDRHSSPMLSSAVIAVRKDSSPKEKSPAKIGRKRRKNNNNNSAGELREHLLRKTVLPSLLEMQLVERSSSKFGPSAAPSTSSPPKKEENSPKIIGKGDLRTFLTSKKSEPPAVVNKLEAAMSKRNDNKSKIIKLRKEQPSIDVVDFNCSSSRAKKIRLDNFPITFVNDAAKKPTTSKLSEDQKSFPPQQSMIRRIVVDNSDDKVNVVNKGDNLVITADDGGQQNKRGAGVGNRSSLFNEVHVQWKKSGAEPVKEGKSSTGGKIKLKRP